MQATVIRPPMIQPFHSWTKLAAVRRECPKKGITAGAFTLVEVLIAMAIMIFLLAGLGMSGWRVIALLEAQREVVAASQLIQERTEAFRAASFSELTNATYVQASLLNSPTNSEAVLHSLTEVLTLSAYPPDSTVVSLQETRQQDVVSVNSTGPTLANAAVVRLDFSLSWLSQRGLIRTRQISTIVAKGGINH